MYRVPRERVHQILHDYKKECYLLEHRSGLHEQVEHEKQRMVKELLGLSHHYEFHEKPTPERAEVINMIENYVREAILPPILHRVCERMLILERRQSAGVRCLERLIGLFEEANRERSASAER